jgi:hypothetical protein
VVPWPPHATVGRAQLGKTCSHRWRPSLSAYADRVLDSKDPRNRRRMLVGACHAGHFNERVETCRKSQAGLLNECVHRRAFLCSSVVLVKHFPKLALVGFGYNETNLESGVLMGGKRPFPGQRSPVIRRVKRGC